MGDGGAGQKGETGAWTERGEGAAVGPQRRRERTNKLCKIDTKSTGNGRRAR